MASDRSWPGWPVAGRLLAAALLLVPAAGAPAWLQCWGLVALLVAVGCVGVAIAGRLLPRLPALDRALAAAVFGAATWVAVGVLLGDRGALTGSAFRATLAGLTLATVALDPSRRGPRPGEHRAVEGTAPARARAAHPSPAMPRAGRLASALVAAALVVVASGLGGAIHHYRLNPPGRFAYDDTSYHLTTVATWVVHHDLRMPQFSYGDPRTAYYPFAGELFAWGLVTPFSGGDFAARWSELPFALLSLLAAAVVARRLGVRGPATLLPPLLYTTVPGAFPGLALAAGNDHALAFAALATVHATLLLARRRPALGRAAYAGAALGLLAGIKLVGLLYLLPLLALALVALTVASGRGSGGARVAAAGCAVAVALLVGGYAYLRNAVTTGNPVYPVPMRLGWLTLPGWDDLTLTRLREAEPGFLPWSFPWTRTDLFGALFRWTMLPAAAVAPFAGLALARARRRLLVAGVLALPVAFYLAFVFAMEDHRGVRYVFAALALAAVAVAWLAGKLPAGSRALLAGLLATAAAATWLLRAPRLSWILPLAALAGWLASRDRGRHCRGIRRSDRGSPALAAMLAGLVVAPFLARSMVAYQGKRLVGQPAAAALARLSGGEPVRLAYVGWNQPYLYCGAHLQNPLSMPPASRTLDAMTYRWRGPLPDPSAPTERRIWLHNLEKLRVEWVVWVAAGGREGPEREWMASSPRRFSRAWGDDKVELWRVRR
jgi:hypothetical protein